VGTPVPEELTQLEGIEVPKELAAAVDGMLNVTLERGSVSIIVWNKWGKDNSLLLKKLRNVPGFNLPIDFGWDPAKRLYKLELRLKKA